MRNQQVIRAWVQGYKAKNSTGALSTDGRDLFSYSLKIGFRAIRTDGMLGEPVVLDYTAKSGHFKSMTTSQHVSLAIREGTKNVMSPTVYEVI